MTSSARLMYMALYLNSMRYRMVSQASRIVNEMMHVSIRICVDKVLNKPTQLPKGMLVSVTTDLLEVIIHLY